MEASVKTGLVLLFAGAMVACGASAPQPAPHSGAIPSTVGTARTMAAEVTDSDEAPKVGKAQRSYTLTGDEKTERKFDHRSGGGFSGYK